MDWVAGIYQTVNFATIFSFQICMIIDICLTSFPVDNCLMMTYKPEARKYFQQVISCGVTLTDRVHDVL